MPLTAAIAPDRCRFSPLPRPTPESDPNPSPPPGATTDAAAPDQSDLLEFCQTFGAELTALEASVADLRDRFGRSQVLWERRQGGDQRIETIRPALAATRDRERRQQLAAELKHLQREQQRLDLALLERLPIEAALREWFWQAVRFGGLGLLAGWLLGRWGS